MRTHNRLILRTVTPVFFLWQFAALAIPAYGQSTNTTPITVRAIDQEAVNAYQARCSIDALSTKREDSCSMPRLPSGKRLAIRWLSMFCLEGERVAAVEIRHSLSPFDPDYGSATRFRSVQSYGLYNDRILEEPVYAHSDEAVSAHLQRRDITNQPTRCTFEVRGYLVDRK